MNHLYPSERKRRYTHINICRVKWDMGWEQNYSLFRNVTIKDTIFFGQPTRASPVSKLF